MLSELEKVIAALKYWGLKPDPRIYAWRFFIQKTAFLLKALGVSINYDDFTIYIKGPYSRELNCDYIDHWVKINELSTSYVPSKRDIEIFEKIRSIAFRGIAERDDIIAQQQLQECISTAIFVKQAYPEFDDDEVFAKVKFHKPYLSDSMIVVGITRAKELLFKPEFLTEEIRNEIDEWNRIDD